MEKQDVNSLWNTLEIKLDRNWKLNLELIRRTNLDRIKKKMSGLTWVVGITLAFYGIATLYFISFTANNLTSPFVALSGIILAIWTLSISIASIHELELISRVDYAKPIVDVQKNLNKLKLAIIRYFRLGVWILPFSFVFIIVFFKVLFNLDIAAEADRNWIIWNQVIIIGLFLPFTIWAHRKLSPQNADKEWMNKLLKGNGSQVNDAIVLLKEIEEFEKEE